MNVKRYAMIMSVFLCLPLVCTAQARGPQFEVGQRWEYRHEGPRPGSVEPKPIDGCRILRVVAIRDDQEAKRWVVEDRFTNDRDVVGRLYVDESRLLTAIEIENGKGEVAKLNYEPPVPYDGISLSVGAEETIETALSLESGQFRLPCTVVIRRLEDETVATPAGEFVDCLHYRTTTHSTVDIRIARIPVTEERERWYHPQANGLVKEVYRKGPVKVLSWSREGYTATSVLTAYARTEIEERAEPTPETAVADRSREQEGHRSAESRSLLLTFLILLAILAALLTARLTLLKRRRR
jgi:hypothetical protein